MCEQLHDPEVRLHEIGIQLMTCFKPQLADRVPIFKLDKVMQVSKIFMSYLLIHGVNTKFHDH